MSATYTSTLDNPEIRKLFEQILTSEYEAEAQEFQALIDYTNVLTSQYNSILHELAELKEKINTIADRKNPIHKMADNLDRLADDVGTKLRNLKESIATFTKNTLESIKQKGLSAIGSAFKFLHVKDGLQAMSKACAKSVESLDKAVARCAMLETTTEKPVTQTTDGEQSPIEQPTSLAELLGNTRMDFENYTQDELESLYSNLLNIGMKNELSANESTCLQSLAGQIEILLAKSLDSETSAEAESELDYSNEI